MMDLGMFSVSLTVKDVAISQDFYEKLGFKAILKPPYPYKMTGFVPSNGTPFL